MSYNNVTKIFNHNNEYKNNINKYTDSTKYIRIWFT